MRQRRVGGGRVRLLLVALLIICISVSGVAPPFSFPPVAANPDFSTLYFVNEQHTVNGLSACKLNETNSASENETHLDLDGGSYTVWVAVRVFIRHSNESETELTDGTYNINVTRSSDGQGIQTVNWTCPQTNIFSGDSLVVRVYLKVGTTAWYEKATFISNHLSCAYLSSTVWTFHLWTKRSYDPGIPKWGIPPWTACYFYWGDSDHESKISNIQFCNIQYSSISPQDNYVTQETEDVTFSVYWSSTSNLSHYIFSYKVGDDWTNETYSFPQGVSEAWSNVTKNVDNFPDSDGKWIYWRFYANDTSGGCLSTPIRRVFNWESLPPVSRFAAGKHAISGMNHIYYNGSKEAIYVVYINTSLSTWMYQIICFNLESYEWIGPFNISSCSSDVHYIPSISILPDGRLIVLYSYYSPLKFRISKYSADIESNLTKLCCNWGEEHSIESTSEWGFCYPEAVRTDNYTVVFGRDGTTYDGDWAYYRFTANNWVYSYVKGFSNSTYEGEWFFEGSSPYVDEYGIKGKSYMQAYEYTVDHYAKIGNFTFRTGWAENISMTAYLEILAKSQEASICTSWNTTWLDVSGGTPTWLSWKLTGKNWTDTLEYIKVYSANDYYTTIYCVRLKLNITGCSPIRRFIEGDPSCYFFRPTKFGNKILLSGVKREVTVNKNIHFVYSDDEGATWKLANGTEVKIPISLEEIKVLDSGNKTCESAGQILYNQTAIIMFSYSNRKVKNYTDNLRLLYYPNLGSNSSWHLANVTLENGTYIKLLRGFGDRKSKMIYDEYYNRPSIWFEAGNKIVKAVALPNNFTIYRIVYEDSEYIRGGFELIHESPEAYEIAGDNMKFLLGYPHIGEYDQNMTNTMAYGCKFNANQTGYLSAIHVYQSPSVADESGTIYIKAAIYNETFDLLAISNDIKWVAGSTFYGWGWAITFPNPPYLEESKTYWIVWKVSGVDNEGNPLRYAYTTGLTNQTIHFPNNYTEPFPSHIDLSQATFYNRKISVYGGEKWLVVRGLGHDVWATEPTQIGVEGTIEPGQTITFHTFWTDNSHLDYAELYWNVSGTMQQSGTLDWADNPTEAWSNFTRTLPNQYGITIAWYIIAYDVYNNCGNTTTQYLQLGALHEVSESFSADVEFDFGVSGAYQMPLTFSVAPAFSSDLKGNLASVLSFPVSLVFEESLVWSSLVSSMFNVVPGFSVSEAWDSNVACQFTFPLEFMVQASKGVFLQLLWSFTSNFNVDTTSTFHLTVPWQWAIQYSSVDTQTNFNVPLSFQLPLTLTLQTSLGALTYFVNLAFTVPINLTLNLITHFLNSFNLNVPVNFSTDLNWNANTNLAFQIPIDVFVVAAKGAAYIVVTSLNIIVGLVTGLTVTYGPPPFPGPTPVIPTPSPGPTPAPKPTPSPTTPTYALLGIVLIVAVIAGAAVYGSSRSRPKISAGRKAFSSRKLKGLSLPKWIRKERIKLSRKVESTLKLPTWRKTESKLPKWKRKKKKAEMKKKKIWD